jgi:hypothetical protein
VPDVSRCRHGGIDNALEDAVLPPREWRPKQSILQVPDLCNSACDKFYLHNVFCPTGHRMFEGQEIYDYTHRGNAILGESN